MYLYYVYQWRDQPHHPWKFVMDVFEGTFVQLILMAHEQPEEWVVTFVKEISRDEFNALSGVIG